MRLIDVLQARNQPPVDNGTRSNHRVYVAHMKSLYSHFDYHILEDASHVTIFMFGMTEAFYW